MAATLKQSRVTVHPEHKFAVTIAQVITSYYQRDLIDEFDLAFSFEFRFSAKRTVAVLVTECDEHGSPCYEALVHVYDPSYTTNYSEPCWSGIGPITEGNFKVAEFVSVLGLASLNGGLASIELKIHFYEAQVHKMAHLIMKIAGVVDMYTR